MDKKAEEIADMLLARVPKGSMTPEQKSQKRIELIERWSSSNIESRGKSDEEERKARDKARLDGVESRKQEWRDSNSFLWMLEPVPYSDEDTEETAWMPLADNMDEVEEIRACARAYEASDKKQWMKGFFFDRLSHLGWDLESVVRREQSLELEFVHGRNFAGKDDPYNVW